ncbi:MAG: DUF1778 domain-containing protein [Actinomycetota bacterium]|nr:DUF1778 domain-containing protein [Actinomycetota bacterium]
MEGRTTIEERELINRTVAEIGTDLTTFVVTILADASRRVLADREQFLHSSETAMQWEKLNEVPACEQGGLCRLMNLPLPLPLPFGE